jgi:hypothetical protein
VQMDVRKKNVNTGHVSPPLTDKVFKKPPKSGQIMFEPPPLPSTPEGGGANEC